MNETLTQTAGCTRRRREVRSVLVLSEDTAQAEGELSAGEIRARSSSFFFWGEQRVAELPVVIHPYAHADLEPRETSSPRRATIHEAASTTLGSSTQDRGRPRSGGEGKAETSRVVRIRMAGAEGREGKRKPPRVLCRCRRDCRRGLSPDCLGRLESAPTQ